MADTNMQEPTAPQNEPVAEPTAKEPVIKMREFTQDELDKKFAERQKRGEEAAAKRFQKQIDELTAKIQDYEGKDLGELEKLQKKLEKLTGEVSEKDKELSGANLKIAKMEALLAAGAQPEQVSKLLKRVAGTTPEEIESDVSELKEMGWIGVKTPPPEPSKAIGGGSQQQPAKVPDLKEQISALESQASKELDPVKRDQLQTQILGLKMRAGGFVIA